MKKPVKKSTSRISPTVRKTRPAEGTPRKKGILHKTLVDTIPDIVICTDLEGKVIFVNDRALLAGGYKRRDVEGQSMLKFVPAEYHDKAVQNSLLILDGQNIGPQEYELLTNDGSRIACEVHGNVLRNEEGTPFGFVRVCRNIAERRHAEDVAFKEYKFSRAVIDSLSAPFFMYDFVNRRFFRWNSAFSALSGYSDGEIARMKLIDFVRESDQGILIGMLDEFKRQGHVSFEMPVLAKDGQITPCLLSGTLLHYEGNDYVVGMGIDITDRKNAEQEVRQSEHMYRLLADHMKDAVWIMDFNLKVTYVSPSAEKLLGWTQEKIKKLALDKLLTPESFKAATDFYAEELPRALAAPPDYGLERTLELEFVRKDGQTLWGECMFSLMRDENGTPVSILGESRNITERKQMEHRLQISESNFRRSLDESPLGVRITSAEGETVYANKTILDIYGYSTTEELQNTPLKERYTPESFAACMERRKNRKNGRPVPQEYEVSIVRKDGEVRHLHVFRKEIFWDAKKYYQVIYNDITERRRAETELQTTQDLYRLLADNISDVIWIMDFKLNLLYISPSVEKIYGYTLDEVKTLKLKKLFTPESYQKVTEAYAVEFTSAMASKPPPPGTRHVMELEAYHKDGHTIWIENRVSLIRDENGKPLSILGETRDITERKRAQVLLKKSEEQYRLLADHMKDQVWLMDLNMQITYISPSVERILEYTFDEIRKMPIDKLLTPDSFNKAMHFISISMPKAMKQSSKDYIFRTLDLKFVSKSGRTLWGECSFSFIRDDNGHVISILGVARDITDRKRAEDMLHRSEEKYRTILEDIQEGYFEVDLKGNYTFVNDTVCRVMGYKREELIGINNQRYTDKEELKKVYQAYHEVYKTGKPNKNLVWTITSKDGIKKHIEGSISLLKDSSGNTLGFRGIAHDITERVRIKQKLREEEQRFRAFAEQSSDIIIMVNKDGTITYENPAVGILGIPADNRLGTNVFERVHPDDLKVVTNSFQQLFSDVNAPVQKAEVRIAQWDGSWRTFEAMGSNLVHDGAVQAVIANLRDITERKHSEEKLQKTLESLKKAVGTTIQVLVSALESRDPYTAGHQSRSAKLACAIAEEMGLDEDKIEGIRMAGVIHDIGKLSIPAEILSKPTKLTKLEFSLIKVHPQSGYDMLKDVESPWPLAQIVHQHHERLDGTGYPCNLKNGDIIMEARIMAVADVVEAMASHRPYRASLGIEAALDEIEKNKGILYDETAADACLKLFKEKGYQLT